MNRTAAATFSALCSALPEGVPEWVELLPASRQVTGRDGRSWRLEDAAAVAAASLNGSKDIPIDWEHSTEYKAPQGEPAPAAGWITELEIRAGALWGRVEWTERGRASVASREYRYLSPVFQYEKQSRRIMRLLSAGLTNSPNFRMTALNQQGEGDAMDIKEILKALGLGSDATVEQAVTAVNALQQERDTARNRAESPSLEKFVPRADYDAALKRAKNAEEALNTQRAEALETEIEGEIAAALEAGKITPATADYHRAQCRAEGGLDLFKKYVAAAPVIAADSGLGKRRPDGSGKALNADERKIAEMFGNSAEDLKKYGGAA